MTVQQKNIVNLVERVGVTFVEGFMATWGLSNFAITHVALYGAIAAGISLAWNTSALIKLTLTKPIQEIEPTIVSSKPTLNIPVS